MKYIINIVLVVFLFTACQKVDDVLEVDDSVYVTLLQTTDKAGALAGDVFKFSVMVNSNSFLKKFAIENKNEHLNFLRDSLKISLVETEIDVDSQGNFSRPLKTLILENQVEISDLDPSIIGEVLSLDITIENEAGKKTSVSVKVQVINHVVNSGMYFTRDFFDANEHSHHRYDQLTNSGITSSLFENMDIYKHDNSDGTKIFYSPNDSNIVNDFADYDYTSMNKTEFIPIEAGVSFNDIDDTFLESMDFSNSISSFAVNEKNKDILIGFKNREGKKGIFVVRIKFSQFANVKTKLQVVPK
jgi:hypothetical protein